jgi:arylformamidase
MQSEDTGALWRGFDREALDRAYNNSVAVAGSAEIVADWEARSAALRERMPQHLDLRYGERPRNRIDFLSAGPGAPTLVFVHGGYWQMRSKETFTFAAQGPLACGISVALVGYTLAPDATLDEIVAEIRDAIDFLAGRLPGLGGDPERLWVSGWSAGGHLAAMVLDHPRVRGGLSISGLYDLEPIRLCYVNEKLGLDADAAKRNSPMLHLPAVSPPLDVVVGGAELAGMRRQSADYAAARHDGGLPGEFLEIPGANHFTIMELMARTDGVLSRLVRKMILGGSHRSDSA